MDSCSGLAGAGPIELGWRFLLGLELGDRR